MNKKRRLIVVSIVLVMLLTTVVAGCSKDEPADQSKQEKTEDKKEDVKETEPNDEQEIIEITYWHYNLAEALDGNFAEKIIEDAVGGIDIKPINIAQSEEEQLQLLMASGDVPDFFLNFGKKLDYFTREHDLVRSIPFDMIEQYTPSYAKIMTDNPMVRLKMQNPDNPDEILALPSYNGILAGGQFSWTNYYRKDWLDALNIAMPEGGATEIAPNVFCADYGYKFDEHNAILRAFTNDDPDGNGENDTTGMIGDKWLAVQSPMLGAFGLSDFTNDDNGKAVYYYSTDRYKELLAYVRDLYQEGLIDQEYVSLDREQFWEKAENSYGGVFIVGSNWLSDWAIKRPPLSILNNEEIDAQILITPGFEGPHGDIGSRNWGTDASETFYLVGKQVDDAKLAKILEFQEYAHFGPRKVELMFGEEGVDFEYDEDGDPVTIGTPAEQSAKGVEAYTLYMQDTQTLALRDSKLYKKTYPFTQGKWLQYLIEPYKYDLFNETNINEVWSDYGSNIETVRDEFRIAVIIGEKDLDAEWENYLADLDKNGYQEVCAELDKAPLYSDLTK